MSYLFAKFSLWCNSKLDAGDLKQTMHRAVAYIRATTGRKDQFVDIAAQRTAIQRIAAVEELDVVAEHVETAPCEGLGALRHRPRLLAALALARTAGCPILVARLDCLSGDAAVIARLMAGDVRFLVAEFGTEVEPFMARLHQELPERMQELIHDLTRAALVPRD